MYIYITLVALFTASVGQFLPNHRGNFVTKLGEYTFEYHDEKGLLLIIVRLDCYIVDAPPGSPIARILDDPITRKSFLPRVVRLIEEGRGRAATSLQEVTSKYHDRLVGALCFVTELYRLDVTALAPA